MTTEELAEGYDAYTDADELGQAVSTEDREAALPTTTVITTTLRC
jgi:hypothetical protein